MSTKLMGLIGATATSFFEKKLKPIYKKYGYAMYGWAIPLRRDTLLTLRDQGKFRLYGYSSSGCYPNPRKATHMIDARFTINTKDIVSHLLIGVNAIRCPEPEKGIRDSENFYLSAYEDSSRFPSRKSNKLPRRTWFQVVYAESIQPPLPLVKDSFTAWNPRRRIHPTPLMSNFIEIVDDLEI